MCLSYWSFICGNNKKIVQFFHCLFSLSLSLYIYIYMHTQCVFTHNWIRWPYTSKHIYAHCFVWEKEIERKRRSNDEWTEVPFYWQFCCYLAERSRRVGGTTLITIVAIATASEGGSCGCPRVVVGGGELLGFQCWWRKVFIN